ncbi:MULTISPECIES: hypothetical protein [unclassified Exiguobacterium]|uniref:DUF6973 domain-containing protein n=1 Tax=unclassified Exiguobacterium TaxID=2644629 RepID=UPI001BE96419|nr:MULTISPECIES: hypothetical protein [unclassified Exiguobacterium]
MKKMLFATSFLLGLFYLGNQGDQVHASGESKDEIEYNQMMDQVREEVDFMDRDASVVDEISSEDIDAIMPQIKELERDHPEMTEEEMDEIVYSLFQEKATTPEEVQPMMMLRSFEIENDPEDNDFSIEANSDERSLCVRHPVKCTKAKSDSETAVEQAEKYYKSSVLYNGNGDAFRHAYWNALMVKSITAKYAKYFADAHEYGADNQPAIERQMDLHNNRLGRYIAETSSSAKKVKESITAGKGVRISQGKLVDTNSSGLK